MGCSSAAAGMRPVARRRHGPAKGTAAVAVALWLDRAASFPEGSPAHAEDAGAGPADKPTRTAPGICAWGLPTRWRSGKLIGRPFRQSAMPTPKTSAAWRSRTDVT